MRLVVLDTETTGLNRKGLVCDGHRVIEIGCVEVIDGKITGHVFHTFLNPGINVDPKATAIHGIDNQFLVGKRKFADVVLEFVQFINDDVIIIHNAPFDIAFLNQEFDGVARDLQPSGVSFNFVDTLELARARFPRCRNDLDALCARFDVKRRAGFHNALEDAKLLAEVYLCMIG